MARDIDRLRYRKRLEMAVECIGEWLPATDYYSKENFRGAMQGMDDDDLLAAVRAAETLDTIMRQPKLLLV